MTSHHISAQVLGHGCVDDLTTERNFGSRATCVIDMLGLFLTCCPLAFLHPGTDIYIYIYISRLYPKIIIGPYDDSQ